MNDKEQLRASIAYAKKKEKAFKKDGRLHGYTVCKRRRKEAQKQLRAIKWAEFKAYVKGMF